MLTFPHVLAKDEGPSPLLPAWSELIIGVIAFVLLLWFLSKFVFPMFEKAYATRTEAIQGGIARAEEAQAEAQRALEQYRAQLAEARHEAGRLREDARAQGSAIVAEMREQAQSESSRIVTAAHAQIESDRQQAFNQLRGQIGEISTSLAERIVGESLTDRALQTRVIERFLAELESSTAQQAVAPVREPVAAQPPAPAPAPSPAPEPGPPAPTGGSHSWEG